MANYQNVVPTQLCQAALTTGYVTLYTAPSVVTNSAVNPSNIVTSTTRTYLKDMQICNTTAGALQLYMSIVPSAGTAGTANAIYYGVTVAANTTLIWQGTQVIMTGATLQAKASATGLTLTASGGEAT